MLLDFLTRESLRTKEVNWAFSSILLRSPFDSKQNMGDNDLADKGGVTNDYSCVEGDGFSLVVCLICLKRVAEDGVRAWASFKCDRKFHLDSNEKDKNETLNSLNFATIVRGIELGPAKKQLDNTEILIYEKNSNLNSS
ncbi:hypothetical protein YC2023_010762 [Brassica napus]